MIVTIKTQTFHSHSAYQVSPVCALNVNILTCQSTDHTRRFTKHHTKPHYPALYLIKQLNHQLWQFCWQHSGQPLENSNHNKKVKYNIIVFNFYMKILSLLVQMHQPWVDILPEQVSFKNTKGFNQETYGSLVRVHQWLVKTSVNKWCHCFLVPAQVWAGCIVVETHTFATVNRKL